MTGTSDKVDEWLELAAALDADRRPWESLWQEQATVCHPRRGMITHQSARVTTPDRNTVADTYDGTAQRANRTLAQGQFSRITPMGARWFALRPPDEIAENASAVSWYQTCGGILARKLAASNFYNKANEHYLDRGAFGTAATEVVGGKGGKGLHFRSFDIGTYSIAHDEQDEVDTISRTFLRTPKQLAQLYGKDKLPESILKKLAEPKECNTPLEIVHLIRPRIDRDPRFVDAKNKSFESIHIYKSGRDILAESGFDEFPVAVSRWELWGSSPYGWAPSYLALPEASQASFLEEMMDTLAEIAAFPRILYGGNIKGDIDFRAMGLTCYDINGGQAPPTEWLTQGRYDIGKDRVADKRRAIEEAFFVPLFNAISQLDRDATATEVRAIVSESRELFHPIFANIVREFLGPILKRSFAILLRQGELPPPPASVLQQDDLGAFIADPGVEYTSAMALALEQSQLANFADAVNVLAPLAQNDPSVFDFIDYDQIGPAFFRYKGLPESFIKSPEAIEAIRQARAEAQQAAALQEATGAVKNLGGVEGLRDLGVIDV